ncbi:hypothetical protein BH10BAC2_BH10BAC2_20380 [soil metagenome]
MKKIFFTLSAIATISIVYLGCSKDIHERTADLPALNPSNIDIDAGAWKLVLLSRPDSFAVAVPAATNLPGYLGELNEIKGLQANLTDDQKSKIKYWSAGAVLRWNEIMRELVAKYNLPPYQNEDGTYPMPSGANPFAYPQFPFSNPPYAARAYAYVSAAQYDALVSCWYYKKLYNRAAPYKVDSTIGANAINVKTDLPSYPSEQAVLAGVTAEMMKMLFPTEIAYINAKVDELQTATMASGACVRSDWTAGEALGRQIASVFAARGRSDNTSKAVGSQAQWDSLATATAVKGEIPWVSLETPKRPPMLPFFGNVKPFLFDSLTVINVLRSGPPPSTGSDQMKKETQEVLDVVTNPSAEKTAIVQFWADGVGTTTPPGHWNAIAAEDFVKQNFSEVRWARNFALLNMAEMDAAIVCWNTKFYYFNPRPSQMNPAIKTLTGMPNFPSYVSGHSLFSGAASTILGHIIPARASDYNAMAAEAAISRLYGGIHYRSDIEIGLETGNKVGDYAIQRALTDGAE